MTNFAVSPVHGNKVRFYFPTWEIDCKIYEGSRTKRGEMDQTQKHERLLRRRANRLGLKLYKSRNRPPVPDAGRYGLFNEAAGAWHVGVACLFTLDDIDSILSMEERGEKVRSPRIV